MRDGNPIIAVTAELPPEQGDDLTYFKQKVRAAVQDALPDDSVVSVRAGQLRWFDANDSWSRAAL